MACVGMSFLLKAGRYSVMGVSHVFIATPTGRHFCLYLSAPVTSVAVIMGVQATVPALGSFVDTPGGGTVGPGPYGSARLHVQRVTSPLPVAAAPFHIPTNRARGCLSAGHGPSVRHLVI